MPEAKWEISDQGRILVKAHYEGKDLVIISGARASGKDFRDTVPDVVATNGSVYYIIVFREADCEHERLYIRWDYCEGGLPTCEKCGAEFTGSEFDSQFTIVRKSAQNEEES